MVCLLIWEVNILLNAQKWLLHMTLSPIISERRRLLCKVMNKEGFANYPGEWWHFSYGDQLWAAYRYKRYALYSSINSASIL